ncbi:hypothetical protein E2562_026100 [Oryza meyeriana var. granulata]|uniref:DUF834 domain-containing protein n=1 Tax=Oryza meyeriana var. granulata TaxID=110450 RepID=A0A6G1C003_9ORYZ|nr:hypothetical protein E2562_026100 [Oryza meyeriana var. granulata]
MMLSRRSDETTADRWRQGTAHWRGGGADGAPGVDEDNDADDNQQGGEERMKAPVGLWLTWGGENDDANGDSRPSRDGRRWNGAGARRRHGLEQQGFGEGAAPRRVLTSGRRRMPTTAAKRRRWHRAAGRRGAHQRLAKTTTPTAAKRLPDGGGRDSRATAMATTSDGSERGGDTAQGATDAGGERLEARLAETGDGSSRGAALGFGTTGEGAPAASGRRRGGREWWRWQHGLTGRRQRQAARWRGPRASRAAAQRCGAARRLCERRHGAQGQEAARQRQATVHGRWRPRRAGKRENEAQESHLRARGG